MASRRWARLGPMVVSAMAVGVTLAPASALTIDFEGVPATGHAVGALAALVIPLPGVTVTIGRPGSSFDVVENTGFQAGKPAGWALHSLDPFVDETAPPHPIIVDFSVPIKSFSIEAGDYGGDTDFVGIVAFTGHAASGPVVDADSAPYGPSAFPTIAALSVGGGPFHSVVLHDDGDSGTFPDSMFWDNIHFAVVPEPGTLALLGLGSLAAFRRRRRA